MTVTTLPTRNTVPPPAGDGGCGDGQIPAPSSTILAVLARLASHNGEPLTVTITEATHTIVVHLAFTRYAAWCREASAEPYDPATPAGTVVWSPTMATCMHGWSLTLTAVA